MQASRKDDRVVVSWNAVWITDDDYRGYLIEATVCQNGNLIPIAVQTDRPRYTFTDELNCDGDSGGRLYAIEKNGCTNPDTIPWL